MTMLFRVKAFGLHLLASVIALTLVLGGLYVGWYRWPGWYLADAKHVTVVLAGVDLVVGPLLTAVVASARKPRNEFVRDVAIIGTLQLCALAYGATQLWNGRPLYYAFSEDVLQLVQAYDIDAQEISQARQRHAAITPHWYDLPRWIWAPLPEAQADRDRIVAGAVSGGDDVISMPIYYKPWESGLPTLRTQLKRLDNLKYFSAHDQKILAERMRAAGYSPDEANAIAMTGRSWPLLAVFDPQTLELERIFQAK